MTFSRTNIEPVAAIKVVAGVNTVALNKTVSLTSAPSYDPNGSRLTYQWAVASKPAGSNAVLTSNGSVLSAFKPDVAGIYEVTIKVTNAVGLFATDKIQLVTGAGLSLANAGPDVSTQVGTSILVDPFRSVQTAGKELTATWRIVSAPISSTATLTNGATLVPHQTGRQRFVPDVPGLYLLSLKVDGGTSSSTDTILISAGSNATATPVANAGSDQFITAGADATLDAIGSTDTDGGILSYRWSILLAPIGSTASVINPNVPISSLHTDIAGNYVVQLSVSDGNSTSFDTVFISTTSQPFSANAGADQILPASKTVNLSGSASVLPQNTAGLLPSWSVLGLGTTGAFEQSQLSSPSQLATNAAFNIVPASTPNPAKALGDYEFIVFQNDNSNSQVYGRTFIGGNLTGQSSDYGNGLAGTASGKVILTVGGLINGQPKNINNGGKVRAGASPTATLNFNGGGSLAVDPTVSIASIQNDLTNFSQTLKAMPSTASITIPTSQPAGVTLNAVPNSSGIAVFSVPQGDTLFNNSKVQSINLNLNGATAVVVNVGGANVKIQQANFIGNLNSDSVRGKVIWNFYDAANINITRAVSGSILAPSAQILNSAQINGSVVTRNINQSAAIITPGFTAVAAFASPPTPVQAVVVQLGLDNGTNSSYDTVLLTSGNIAPLAKIQSSAISVQPDTTLTFSGASSSDANGNTISYRWSLLAAPSGNNAPLINPTTATTTLTPVKRGIYIAQLVTFDGSLLSDPVTIAIKVQNSAPLFAASTPSDGLVGEPWSFSPSVSDADGDALQWALENAPAGMMVDSITGLINWTPANDGNISFTVKVADGNGGSASKTYAVAVTNPVRNRPPVISGSSSLSVLLGQRVDAQYTAVDPDGDAVLLSILPQPLPAGISFDSATGKLSVRPTNAAAGTITLVVTATDGQIVTSFPLTITVGQGAQTDPTLLSGRVLDALDYANGITTPVVGAVVAIGGIHINTGPDGVFVLTGLQAGNAIVSADGTSASFSPDGKRYGIASSNLAIYAHASNTLDGPLLVSRLSTISGNVTPGAATTVSNPNVSLNIPTGSATNSDGTPFSGPLYLVDIPGGSAGLPVGLHSCSVFELQPQGVKFAPGATLTFANQNGLVAGSKAVIWAKSNVSGLYERVGSATVSADGTKLISDNAVLSSATRFMIAPLPAKAKVDPLQPRTSSIPNLLGDGNLQSAVALPAYASLGQSRAASFVYNSTSADPRPIIQTLVTLQGATGLPTALDLELEVGGVRIPGSALVSTIQPANPASAALSETGNEVISISLSFDASALPTGVYDYTLRVFGAYSCSSAADEVTGKIFVENRQESSFGQRLENG